MFEGLLQPTHLLLILVIVLIILVPLSFQNWEVLLAKFKGFQKSHD